MKRVLLYSAVGGVLIAALRFVEYQHFVRAYPGEVYGGLVAVLFTAVGAYLGLRWTRNKEVVVVKEVRVRESGPFTLNADALREAGLTPREHEILGLIEGMTTNAERRSRLPVEGRET